MKTRRIISILILACALWPAGDVYACCYYPQANMSAGASAVCVGSSVTFDANSSYDWDCRWCTSCGGVTMINGIRKFEWDWTANGSYDHTESPGDGKASHTYSTPGTYTCRVQVTDDDDDCCCDGEGCEDHTDTATKNIRVVKVDKVVREGTSDEGPLYLCVDGSVILRAEAYPSGYFPSGEPHWTIESQPTDANAELSSETGATTTLSNLTKPGDYEVKAKCGSSDTGDTVTVTTVEVASVGQSATEECTGEGITFTATASPSGKPLDCIQWEKQYRADSTEEWGDWGWASGYDPNAVLSTSTSGQYQYRARNGSADAWETSAVVTIVKVDKLQYNDPGTGWTDITTTLYVHQGTSVTFKAIPKPDGASWPTGKPVWGGTAGASGTGSTESVTFNTLSSSTSDYKTVTAEDCGSTVTANVVVFDFDGTLTPADNFSGRSTSKYGIAEDVALAFSTNPSGVTASNAGGLEWSKVVGGVGEVSSAGTDGTADYDAGASAGSVELRLTITSGPSKDDYKSYSKTVIEPSGCYMVQKPGTGIWHINNTASVGFKGWSYLLPKNVSFTNIERREGTCTATAWGFYADVNGLPHAARSWYGVSDGDISTGCKAECVDTVNTDARTGPYSIGDFQWPIPREYRVDANDSPTQYATATHHSYTNATGTCSTEKAGAGPFSKNPSDPTSDY